MQPAHVTFTGFDAWTPRQEMVALAREFPIEWGILLHPQLQGEGRYPPLAAVAAVLDLDLAFSAHLCGGYARSAVRGEDVPDHIQALLGRFRRIQVNTSDRNVDPKGVAVFAGAFDARAILQCRGLDRFPSDTSVDWLFDRSGGRGLLPPRWPIPEPANGFVGYSGGLGPDTVAGVLATLARQHPAGMPFWIDMEGAIRTEERLDLGKCRHVCAIAYAAGGETPARWAG
jgi:hypothetical protein